MKRIILCAAAVSLIAFAPAYAQNNDHRGDNRDAATPDRGNANPGRPNDRQKPAPKSAPAGRAGVPQNHPAQNQGLPGMTSTPQAPRAGADHAPNTGAIRGGAMQGGAMQSKPNSRDQMGRANRPDIQALHRNEQSQKRFRSGNYRAPQGYRSRHWTYGERLPRTYFLRNYWITNFLTYGLFAPPSDLIWVRVGNDALLIDRDSGDIVQVRYGVFY